jgi:hypothetical protein
VSSDPEFAGYLSYVRTDDDDGGIAPLCEALEREIRLQLGRPFQIFRDVADIPWGGRWERRLDDTLDHALVLIPMITPWFFSRPECRREVDRFLEREKQLGRDELIFPIHYVETRPAGDPLATELFERQMADCPHPRCVRRVPVAFGTAARCVAVGRTRAWRADIAGEPDADDHRRSARPPEKPLEIIGQGPRDEIVVRVEEDDALLFHASFGASLVIGSSPSRRATKPIRLRDATGSVIRAKAAPSSCIVGPLVPTRGTS